MEKSLLCTENLSIYLNLCKKGKCLGNQDKKKEETT